MFIVIFFFQCSNKANYDSSLPLLRVGVSYAPVNPPVGSFIAGDKQNRKFTGVHDSLFVKVIVVDDGFTPIAIVTIDCIGLLYPDVQRIRHHVAVQSDFPVQHIVVSSTHTHSGPDVVGLWGSDYQHSGVDSVYINFLVRTTAEQIIAASQTTQLVDVVRVGETQFGDPWVQNICDDELDRSVTTMQFLNNKGESLATLTNFACHPTFLDAHFTEVSADYIGGFYKQMNQDYGGLNLFLQGPVGGWVQPVDGEGTPEKAERRGRELAASVMQALLSSDTMTDQSIKFTSKNIQLQVDNEGWKQLSELGTIARKVTDVVETEIVWFSIGTAQFATHPGETAPYFGLQTKELMASGPRFILGLGMDALGYILKPEYFDDDTKPHAPYLTGMSIGRSAGPQIMEVLEELATENSQ